MSKQLKTEKKEYNINNILSKGMCVKFTHSVSEAASAFKDASTPKEWWVLRTDGTVFLQSKSANADLCENRL